VVVLCALVVGSAIAQEAEVEKHLETIAKKAKLRSYDGLWELSKEIAEIGEDAADPILDMLPNAGQKERLVFDAALFELREASAATEDLMSLVGNDKADLTARLLAVDLIESKGMRTDVRKLFGNMAKYTEPLLRIAVCRASYSKLREVEASRLLREYARSADYNTRAEAAIALAQIDDFDNSKEVLKEVSKEPSRRGQLAVSLLLQDRLFQEARSAAGLSKDELLRAKDEKINELKATILKLKREKNEAVRTGSKLLDEILSRIQYYYVDEKKIDSSKLIDSAAKGMVGSLDRYSNYMDERETKLFYENLRQEYSGIGARVSKQLEDYLLIESPIYSGPAYRAGLRSGDKITKVDGHDILRLSIEEVVDKLKGKEGTPVTITVRRVGWPEDRDFTIVRESINLPSVRYEMLPGKIGYLALSSFGSDAVKEVDAALSALDKQGMKALVFDLRYNPGGLLDAAVKVADKFLKGRKLIVSSKGRNPMIAPEETYYSRDEGTEPEYPVYVLVNRGSASASEIVSGALQDHKRATIVGETTFGKGSVQKIFKILATEGKSCVRLTIAKYYLPSGRSIHRDEETGEGGVKPDLEVELPELPPLGQYKAALKLQEDNVYEKYLEKHYKEHRDVFHQLAVNDRNDYSKYPDFDKWYKSLSTELDKEYVRMYLRLEIRRKVADDLGKEPGPDISDDYVLQRGIVEALKGLNVDVHKIDEYKHFADKFKTEKPKEEQPEGK
jgi:carboxyl-terminal processing protease